MGWAAVGLDRGDDQVWSPDGCVLFCDGLGRGAASGTQRVLNRAPSRLTHPLPSFRAFAAFSTPVPAACIREPVYRRMRF